MPPPSCSVISEASETVCTPHTSSFGLPDANEVVCIPHTISFDLPDTSEVVCPTHHLAQPSKPKRGGVHPTHHLLWPSRYEQAVCIPHTAPFKHFYPPLSFGGDFLSTTMGWCDGYHAAPISFHSTPRCWGVFPFFAAQMTGQCDTHTPPPISLRLSPLLLGGILCVACTVGAVWYPHTIPILHHSPPFNRGFLNVN